MRVYSRDLRQRILNTVERGEGSLRQIAKRFLVSLSFVIRLLRHDRTTGSLDPGPHGGGWSLRPSRRVQHANRAEAIA